MRTRTADAPKPIRKRAKPTGEPQLPCHAGSNLGHCLPPSWLFSFLSYLDHRLSRVLPETIAIPINAEADGVRDTRDTDQSEHRRDHGLIIPEAFLARADEIIEWLDFCSGAASTYPMSAFGGKSDIKQLKLQSGMP